MSNLSGATPHAIQLHQLLTYLEEVEKLKRKPPFTLPSAKEAFVGLQHEMLSLPEITFNQQSGSDEVWLRIPRLQQINAPELDPKLVPWVTLNKSPERLPVLKEVLITQGDEDSLPPVSIEDQPHIRELFDWYLEFMWEPWAQAEIMRRKTMTRYNQLFAIQQARSGNEVDSPNELVWGIGIALWKGEGFPEPVRYPLIVQSCEITLNESTLDIEVRPRGVEPRIELDSFASIGLPGVKPLEDFWRTAISNITTSISPFEEVTFEALLRVSVGHLDSSGAYLQLPSEDQLPPQSDHLVVTNSWVLFERKRSTDIFLEDVRRLKARVMEAAELPGALKGLVEISDDSSVAVPEVPFRGLSTSDASGGARDLYFPMPYNDEQVSIVQKLHANDGVVVQGPPGTGKTHTIANIICHYLAEGKRVLVTSKGDSALGVLQEKLPERIRALSVGLLSSERDGMRQFESSIQMIAANVSSMNTMRATKNIEVSELQVNQLHAEISHVDQEISKLAATQMQKYAFKGSELGAADLARIVGEDQSQHEWLDDKLPDYGTEIGFSPDAVEGLRKARIMVGADLHDAYKELPSPNQLPSWAELEGIHQDLLRAKNISVTVASGKLYPLRNSLSDTTLRATQLIEFLDQRRRVLDEINSAGYTWSANFLLHMKSISEEDPMLVAMSALHEQASLLERERKELLLNAVTAPIGVESNQEFIQALERLTLGKSAFLLPFGNAATKLLLSQSTVLALPAKESAEWKLIASLLEWRKTVQQTNARWNALCLEYGFEQIDADLLLAFRQVLGAIRVIQRIKELQFKFNVALKDRLDEVFNGALSDEIILGGESAIDRARDSLSAHVDKDSLSYAVNRVSAIAQAMQAFEGSIVDSIQQFVMDVLGTAGRNETEVKREWDSLELEIGRLHALKDSFLTIRKVTEDIERAGAALWAARLRSQQAINEDSLIPEHWVQSWEWRQAYQLLERIDAHHKLRELFAKRHELTKSLASAYQDLIAEKTWLSVHQNSPTSVRQALQAYLNAVQAMGAGTGKRAVRYRKHAQEAMEMAYQAVPCWILPHWRVSETLPSEIGLFDLVIIDEASQSDIWALPALMRGKKLLVVGDHEQVSPSAVGTSEEKIISLAARYLKGQPHGAHMTPERSIYDLARVVFAGNSVMLKEHFRCVPAIIEFSNREIYDGQIRPLRLPKASERLDPPLIDVYVKGGFRKGDINDPEAKAIVDEIELIIADPAMAGKTIGVVTLIGTEQANHIYKMVSSRVSPIEIIARQISIGPPPVFQGKERDIMLVSMVADHTSRASANKNDIRQRINVAMSRARDRMYLFRSVSTDQFREDTLSGKIISHFKQPFRVDAKESVTLRERCDSGFEEEMFDELVRHGYRVRPQVPCGGYRIDFVVEGADGRRLAIECDGDRYHGPGQWQDDMTRQRVLERAGWTFWRCFASSFVRRRNEVLSDLFETLNGLGIEPLGSETVDNSSWVGFKEVDPYLVDEDEQEEEISDEPMELV